MEVHYRNNGTGNLTTSKYHEAVLDLYREAGREAHRVLRTRGVLIVKCQDEVCSNRQRFTHVEIMQAYKDMEFVAEDLFVVMRNNRPGVSRVVKQVHTRKNHSYFLVFWKRGKRSELWESPIECRRPFDRDHPREFAKIQVDGCPVGEFRHVANTNRARSGNNSFDAISPKPESRLETGQE